MDALLFTLWMGTDVSNMVQTQARGTVYEVRYGAGCEHGYRVASRMGCVMLLQHVMDITVMCKDFLLFPRRSSVWVILLSTVIEVTVNIVMGVVQRFV